MGIKSRSPAMTEKTTLFSFHTLRGSNGSLEKLKGPALDQYSNHAIEYVNTTLTTRRKGSMARKKKATGGNRITATRIRRVTLPLFPGRMNVEVAVGDGDRGDVRGDRGRICGGGDLLCCFRAGVVVGDVGREWSF